MVRVRRDAARRPMIAAHAAYFFAAFFFAFCRFH
jgi:hypothetical protein